ncbi:uncharacterized protein LOC124143236 [Haliotis rufescens]|uniref:uncharacterized protein LOC124143236 n=1 Tax=Haliotis rufescens TaxID=6454 RepID=UPI00201F8C9F|nr:uncharacterized protein LOC124143236 [Haliotis rufescens]
MMESRLLFQLAMVAATVTLSVQRVTPPPNACANWNTNEPRLYPSNGRCDRFYQCSERGASANLHCRLGTFFSFSKQTCDFPRNVIQEESCDMCSGRTVHPYMNSCEVFYECTNIQDAPVLPRCCPTDQVFVENVGCQPRGFGDAPCTASNYTHPKFCRNYFQCVDSTLTTFCCPVNERFDGERCVPDPDGICSLPCEGEEFTTPVLPTALAPRSKVCDPQADSELDNIQAWGMTDSVGSWVGNQGPVLQSADGQSGIFGNGAHLSLSQFYNNVMAPFTARVRFQPEDLTSFTEQDLLSNACNTAENALTLSVVPASRTVRVSVGGTGGTSTEVTWNPTSSDAWLEATVQFANQNLSVSVTDGQTPIVRNSVTYAGSVTNTCQLRVGLGASLDRAFNGKVDRVTAWKCVVPGL